MSKTIAAIVTPEIDLAAQACAVQFSKKGFNKALSEVCLSVGKAREKIHGLLLIAAYQAYHGDIGPAQALYAALDSASGVQRKGISTWLVGVAPVYFKGDMPQLSRAKLADMNVMHVSEYMEVAELSPKWFECAKASNVTPDTELDIMAKARDFIARMEKEVESGKKNVQHLEVLQAMQLTIAKFGEVATTESNV